MSDKFNEDELQEEIDFFISTMMERVLDDYALMRNPIDGSLEAALNAYTKEKLLKLAAENGIAVQKSWKKAKLVGALSDGIMDSLDGRFLILQKRALTLLQYMADGKFDLAGHDLERIEFMMTVFEVAVRMGIVYVSEEIDGVAMVMPVPIKEKLDDTLANFDNLVVTYELDFGLWVDISEVLTAGVNLYGVLTVEKFYDLWKIRHSLFDVEDFDKLEEYLPLLIIRNGYYFVNGSIIANPAFDNDEDVLEFYKERSERMGSYYYEPSKEEILYYAETEFNRNTTAYKRLKLEAAKMSDDFETLMQVVETHMLLGNEVTDLMMQMLEMGVMHFESENQLVHFMELYYAVQYITRLWENAGNTPEEMGEKWNGRFNLARDYFDNDEDDVEFDDFDFGNIISLDDFR